MSTVRAVSKKACKQGLVSIIFLVFLLFFTNDLSRQCVFSLLAAVLFMNPTLQYLQCLSTEKALHFLHGSLQVVYKSGLIDHN